MCRILALSVSGQSIRNNKDEKIIARSHGAKTNVEIISVAFLSEIPLKKTRMHSSRMRTARSSSRPGGGWVGGGVSPHTHTPRDQAPPPREQNS